MLLLLKCLATLCCVCLVIRSCLTLFDPMDCSPPGSSVHGDSPGKNTEVGCHALLQGIFPTQGSTQVSRIIGRFFTVWATREVPSNSNCLNLTKEWYLIWSYNSLLSQTFQFLINIYMEIQFSSVQSLSHVRLFATPWIQHAKASLSITNSWSSLRLTSIESVMPSSHLILCLPLLLLPPIPSSIRVFSNESTLQMRWPKYWIFSFSIIPSKEIPGLISFRMDWLDLLVVQGTLKSLLQHHLSKTSILRCSAFFTVQLSHPYMTTGKTIALTTQTFVGKVMSLLLNMLSRLVITFLPRSKRLLISWLQSPSALILEPKK